MQTPPTNLMWTFATAILVYLNLLECSTELRYGHRKEPKEDGIGKKPKGLFSMHILVVNFLVPHCSVFVVKLFNVVYT